MAAAAAAKARAAGASEAKAKAAGQKAAEHVISKREVKARAPRPEGWAGEVHAGARGRGGAMRGAVCGRGVSLP